MPTFTIETDNNITAFAAVEDALNHGIGTTEGTFSTEKELTKLSAAWPIARFAEVWNGFAGVVPFDSLKPIKKFTDRKTAIARIWKAIQVLTPAPAQHAAPAAPKKAKATKEAKPKDGAPSAQAAAKAPRDGSKKAIVLDLLKRAEGATLKEIMAATDWQAHSVRGFISGSLGKKMGLKIDSAKREDGERVYHAV
jgi:hypothetical protein